MLVITPVVFGATEVLLMVNVNVLPLREKLLTVAVTPVPLTPVSVTVSARATELSANMKMAAAVVSKALRNMFTSFPQSKVELTASADRLCEGREQKSGVEV